MKQKSNKYNGVEHSRNGGVPSVFLYHRSLTTYAEYDIVVTVYITTSAAYATASVNPI